MPTMQNNISRSSLEKILTEHRLVRKGEGVVIGVSGGVDSMVLAHLFSEIAKAWRLKLTFAHVNHGLRGRASDADENFVRDAARKLSASFCTTRWKPQARANIQDAARRFRYDFFLSVAKDAGAARIATAHNLDDQAETLLLHLIRGSGIKGMSGIEWSTGGDVKIIRPLLAFDRNRIEAYAEKKKIRYAHDASNDTTKYTRNFVRHKILPALESLNPRVRESLADAALAIRDCSRALDDVARAFAKEFMRHAKGKIVWNREPYLHLPCAIRRHVLITAYEGLKGNRANLNSDQIGHAETISMGTRPSARYMLPDRIEFRRTGELLSIQSTNS
jgi:tRNA(Ile)-lysidine synthase